MVRKLGPKLQERTIEKTGQTGVRSSVNTKGRTWKGKVALGETNAIANTSTPGGEDDLREKRKLS